MLIGPVLLVAGVVVGAAGVLLLRRSGTGWRVGRLLAAAPQASLEDAVTAAHAGDADYVRLHGRIDSDEDFPGDDGEPLVFRRRRLQRRSSGGTWTTMDDERLAVPFGLSERGIHVGIDADALGDGLVVVPRISDGVAGDLTPEASTTPLPELSPATPVRLRIDRVVAVEHATAAGVPRLADDGSIVLGPGLDRPLVLTTLALDEAMRVLAAERRASLRVAAGALMVGPMLLVVGAVAVLLGQ